MIEGVIFDMDGVLTDSEELLCRAAIEYFATLGVTVSPQDFRPFIGTGENRYIGGVAEQHGLVIDVIEAKRRVYEMYLSRVEGNLSPFPGAQALVEACRDHGLKTAVASSADLIKVAANLKKIGLPAEGFDAVVTAENVERKKPAPDIFLAAAEAIGLRPSQCLVIEDAVNGVEAAKAAGMTCFAVAHSFAPEFLSQADCVFPDIAAITIRDLLGGGRE